MLLTCASNVLTADEVPNDIPMGYIPKKIYAIVAGCCYIFTAGACLVWSIRYWGRYMLAIVIPALFYALGLFLRVVVANDPTNVTKPQILTKVFVASDVATFLVQGSGGGMVASDNPNTKKIGEKVFLAGLIAQLVSFVIYSCLFAVFVFRLRKHRLEQWNYRPDGIFRHWLVLVAAMAISCQNITIRSVFRVVENAQGFYGYLAIHEQYFYTLDCLVLWFGITVFIIVWPPRYLTGYRTGSSRNNAPEITPADSKA
ncbi:hypothetical protein RSOLAG22IIIB_09469 [Rhizoctonia solani]|uniref:Uncharacterized protein n=1 Tax=Rhizoctonia solani TaxID=456999 RepID=A0A0K6FYE9_9AGAM|nr:hypothetical protein RSOLAG22IIIB_09469 [Rhizoctonia solani]